MHSKQKGNIAEAATILRLSQLGFNVFKEIGDLSKVDLLAEKEGKVIRVQCKGITPKKGVLDLSLRKTGPNYTFHYSEEMFDYFSVVNLETMQVAFVPSKVLNKNKSSFTLRLVKAKNKSRHGVNYFDEFLDITEN